MDPRLLTLTLPSAVILLALVWHSFHALPRARAIAFWVAVLLYGTLRGLSVRWVTEAIGASFPYEIRNPVLSVAGISLQEVAGWAVVSYLAWWIGWRFSLRAQRPWLFLQVAWASLFLGAISWAIEAAAIAARWWHWTLPTASRVFLNVPAIGIVDWFFVGIDFLLPFVAITAPSLAASRWRYATLLIFPAHFGGHLLPGVWLHVVHWILVGIAMWLALRSKVVDQPFDDPKSRAFWIPTAGFGVIALDVALVDAFVAGRPELLPSIVPAMVIWLAALRPVWASGLAFLALLLAVQHPALLVSTATGAGSALMLFLRKRRLATPAIICVMLFAVALHASSARDREQLSRRLDAAISMRDRGNLREAVAQFDSIARDHPATHVPLMMAAEIDYRMNQLDPARARLERAVEIRHDFVRGYRLLAVIDAQQGRRREAQEWARLGLEIDPDDLQLRYLAGEEFEHQIDSPETATGMVALAFEAGDVVTARRVAMRATERWPENTRLRQISDRLNAR